jgi:hypothetical protein
MRDGRVLDIANNKACAPSERTTYNLDLQYGNVADATISATDRHVVIKRTNMCCCVWAGLGEGLPELKDWVVDHMRKLHRPKYDNWTGECVHGLEFCFVDRGIV